jgi:hypothetical protein
MFGYDAVCGPMRLIVVTKLGHLVLEPVVTR